MKLLKTIVILTLVVALLTGGAVSVLADSEVDDTQPIPSSQFEGAGRNPWFCGKARFMSGLVDTITDDSIILESGKEIFVDEDTKFKGNVSELKDIEPGMRVVALGSEEEGQFHARYILVIPVRPKFSHHVGEIIAYEPGESITIEDKRGQTTHFEISDDFKITPPRATVEVGDWVTIISRRDSDQDNLMAIGVVVHPVKRYIHRCIRLCRLFERVRLNELERISGTVDIEGTTLTIDPTPGGNVGDEVVLHTDDKTIVTLRGALCLEDGQSVIAFYREEDGTKVVKIVLVGNSYLR